MNQKKINLSKIIPDGRNTNKHTQHGMGALDSSIEQVGIIESITISNDDVIISGNARHERIGEKFTKDAILIETDGTQPIVIKRTDIKSGTAQFHKASILANTVAQKNQIIDKDLVLQLAEEFEFKADEVFVEVVDYSKKNKEINLDQDEKFTITLNFTSEDFFAVKEAIAAKGITAEQIMFKALKLG
jgi:hypothetical protein